MEGASLPDLLRLGAGALLVTAGFVFIGGGVLGLLRFPDLYTRLHAGSAADRVGTVIVIAGLAAVASDWAVALRLGLLAALIIAAGPLLTHAVAAGAHAAGLAPIAGRYRAPRPGARRGETP